MLVINVCLAWLVTVLAIVYTQAEHVVSPAFLLVGTLYSAYVGVGHLDLRQLAITMKGHNDK